MIELDTRMYSFSDSELKQLAFFFRCCETIPDALLPLNAFAETYVYSSMTIEEAELFFTDK